MNRKRKLRSLEIVKFPGFFFIYGFFLKKFLKNQKCNKIAKNIDYLCSHI